MRSVILVGKLTFHEAIRNRWVAYFAIAFSVLAFFLSYVASTGGESLSNFDRSAAMLLNILLLFIPLLGFTLGAQLIAADRESGSLVYLLSQPLSKKQLFFGKVLGASLAMISAISIGFAVAGFGIALRSGGRIGSFLILWSSSILFILICVSVGVLISVVAPNRARAVGTATMAWLAFTVLGDLGLMGAAYILRLRSEGIVGMALLNPVESYKILVVRLLANNLEALGAGGIYLDYAVGDWLPYLLVLWLFAVALGCMGFSCWLFNQQEEL